MKVLLLSKIKTVYACVPSYIPDYPGSNTGIITTSTPSTATSTPSTGTGSSTTTTTTTTTTTPTTTTTTTTATCGGVGWTLYNGYEYCFVTDNDQYQPGAIQACQALGAQLVSIHSAAENAFINSLTGGNWQWIGMMRICATAYDNACFVNVDGTPVNYVNWRAGQPDNYGPPLPLVQENYVTMSYGYTNGGGLGYWDDQAGMNYAYLSSPLPYTCKRPQ